MKKEIINADKNKKNKNKKEKFSKTPSYSKPIIKFIFESGEELAFDKNIFLTIKPELQNNNKLNIKTLKNNSIEISLPNNISKEDISLFLEIIKNLFNKENKNNSNEDEKIDENKIMN